MSHTPSATSAGSTPVRYSGRSPRPLVEAYNGSLPRPTEGAASSANSSGTDRSPRLGAVVSADDGDDAVTPAQLPQLQQQLRQLKRENHLLRLQVLKMQRERGRGVVPRPSSTNGGVDSVAATSTTTVTATPAASSSSVRPARDTNTPLVDAEELTASASSASAQYSSTTRLQPPSAETSTTADLLQPSAVTVGGSDESEALRLRLGALQRQMDRERTRWAAVEQSLRNEIELLRLAVDSHQSRSQVARGDGYASEASCPSSPQSRMWSASVSHTVPGPAAAASSCASPLIDFAARPSPQEQLPCVLPPPSVLTVAGDGAADASSSRVHLLGSGDAKRSATRKEEERQGVATAGPDTISSPSPLGALFLLDGPGPQASVPPHTSSPLSSSPETQYTVTVTAPAISGTGPSTASSPTPLLSASTELEKLYHATINRHQSADRFALTDADELVQRTANRREQRRQRLQQAGSAYPGASVKGSAEGATGEHLTLQRSETSPLGTASSAIGSERGGGGMAPAGMAGPSFSATTPPTSVSTPSLSSIPPVRRSTPGVVCAAPVNTHLSSSSAPPSVISTSHTGAGAASSTHTLPPPSAREAVPASPQAAHPMLAPFNPNQIGVEINEAVHNRSWYLRKALALCFLRVVQSSLNYNAPPQPPSRCASELKSGGGVSAAADPVTPDTSPLPVHEGQDLMDYAYLFSSSSSSEATSPTVSARPAPSRSPTTNTSVVGGGRIRRSFSDYAPADHHSGLPSAAAGVAGAATALSPTTGGGGGGSTPWMYREMNPVAVQRAIQEGISMHVRCVGNEPQVTPGIRPKTKRLPPFADENTDPNLLAAFSPPHMSADARALQVEVKPHHRHRGPTDTITLREDELHLAFHAPVIFNQIRGFLNLDVDNFRTAAAQSPWRQSLSPGKSGTTLFFFGDYTMKSVRRSEMTFLEQRFLPAYVQYCERNPHTLLPRFYALLSVTWLKLGTTTHFILMQNVFTTRYYIHRIYDIKGSTVGRTALVPGKPPPRNAFGALLLKDNDVPAQLVICGAYQRAILLAQLRSDVDFLRGLNIVDYSCMVGIRSRVFSREEGPSKTILLRRRKADESLGPQGGQQALFSTVEAHASDLERPLDRNAQHSTAHAFAIGVGSSVEGVLSNLHTGGAAGGEEDTYVCLHGCDGGLLSLPLYTDGDDTTAREEVYYVGIIDVLQEYTSAKRLESLAKGMMTDRRQISVIPPKEYSERLYSVLERIST